MLRGYRCTKSKGHTLSLLGIVAEDSVDVDIVMSASKLLRIVGYEEIATRVKVD